MNAKLIKKCMAFGMAFSIGLSSWSHTAFADTPRNSATQLQSVQEFVPISRLVLKDGRNLLMDDWKFHLGETDSAEQNIFDDSKWSLVNLPHDYSIHQDYTTSGEAESGYLKGGIGWYRKTFQAPADLQGKKVFIEFDGVYMNAEVYLNGRKLGEHPYGYTAFAFDLTKDLRIGEENVLAVKVNNNTPTSRWYSGSGIYRNVYLNVENAVYIEKDSVVVTTPNVSSNPTAPNVNVKVKVKNTSNTASNVSVKVDIRKKGEEEVLATTTLDAQNVNTEQSVDFTAVLTVNNAKLWTLSNPNLYQAEVTVLNGLDVLDKQVEDFGFRWFDFDAQNGFSLNGQKLKLQGVCMHHDQGSLGSAAYVAAISRQLDILKGMGVNAIRASHNPMSEDFVRLTNEKGILLIQEAFDTWTINKNGNGNDYGKYFNKPISASNEILGKTASMTWGEFDTKAMVKRDRNAPSIIMWSTGNEVLEGNDWGQSTHDYPNIVGKIATWMKQEDDTRPATIGDNKIKDNNPTGMAIADKLDKLGGIIGFNYANSYQLQNGHNRRPAWKMYASETSSAVNSRGVYTHKNQNNRDFTLTSYDDKTVGWGQLASEDWYNVITKDYVAGNFVWTGFDYMGEPTPWNWTSAGLPNGIYRYPAPKSSYFGIVDLAGFPKDRYYFYASQWRKDVTTLHLLPEWHEGIVGYGKNIVVYSNAPKVKLFFTPQGTSDRRLLEEQTMSKVITNAGHSYMTTKKEGNHRDLYYQFSKPYEAGKLEVEAYDSEGHKIENTFGRNMVQTTGQPTKLKATVKKTELTADGRDLAYVEIDVLDANDNIVPTAKNDVTVTVSGVGELAAMDNGKQSDMTKFNAGHREAFSGKVLAIVRSKRENGSINVNISAVGLQGTSVTLNARGAKEDSSDVLGFRYSKNYYVKLGSPLTLPEQIKVVKKSGEENANVAWDKTGLADKLNTPGNFQVKGNVEGVGMVVVNVQVLDEVVALLNYSTYTRKGVVPSLPTVRPAVDKNDNVLDAFFNVSWKAGQLEESRFETPGIVTVEGTATVFDKQYNVIATVRVVEAQVNYSASVTGSALDVRYNNNPVSEAKKLSDNNKEAIALATQANSELEFTYATAVNIGRVVVHYTGTEPQVQPEWSLGSGLPYSGLNAKVNKEANKVIYDFQSVSAVGMKLKFANAANVTEVELVPATESVTVNKKAELESLSVDDVPVSTALLTLDEISVAGEGTIKATGKDNTAVTVLPTKEKKAILVLESEDHKTRLKKTVLLGQGEKDILLSTLPNAKAFAYFTNDKDPGSNDRIYLINDGKKEDKGNSTPRWSDWQRTGKLRNNYIGIILPKQEDVLPTVSQLMFMPFKDGGTQKPSRMEVQVYTGDAFEMPEENKLSQIKEIPDHALAVESNWQTVKTVSGSEIQDLKENKIVLPEAKETRAIRLKLEQNVPNQSLAVVELEVFGKYVEKEPVLISRATSEATLPKAMASFTNDGKVDVDSADRIYLINDNKFGYTPSQAANRWTNWQRQVRTGNEWVGILFGKESNVTLHKVSHLDLSFFEDNGCKIPQSFKVQYYVPKEAPKQPVAEFEGHVSTADIRNKNGRTITNPNKDLALALDSNWADVEAIVGNTTKDSINATDKNRISFKPVETYALRILMTPQSGKSLAVTELEVYGLEVAGNGSVPTPQPQPEKDAHLKVFPSLREYETVDGSFEKAALKRMIIVDNDLAKKNNKVKEAVRLVNQEFAAYGIPSNQTMPILFAPKTEAKDGDIVVELKNSIDGVNPPEGFTVHVDKKITIEAKNSNGVMYALRTIMQYMQLHNAMPYGMIKDYPDTDERALHLDMGRKYFTPDWIKRTIRELSFMRINAIQLHFSEHEGYRLESETYPKLMSDQYVTKDQMKEIIAEAKKYGVEVIPALNSPGHLRAALRNYPEFQVTKSNGRKDTGALDINNDEARQFIKNLFKEYAELFADSTYFHIGADEYINFNKPYEYPSMTEFAHRRVGPNATWQDGYMTYINEIAEHVHGLGFRPRTWNDGIYRSNSSYSVKLHDYIQIGYWTQWDAHMPSIQKLLDNNHELINVNDSMYYVLTLPNKAYAEKPNPEKIYREIDVQKFPDRAQQRPPRDKVKGLTYAIWCDVPDRETEAQVTEGIYYSLRAMAEKAWAGKQAKGVYSKFETMLTTLKGILDPNKQMPNAQEITYTNNMVEVQFRHVANTGQVLGNTEVRIGQNGTTYQYQAPKFKEFEYVDSTDPLNGTFTENKVITLNYEKTTQRKVLEQVIAAKLEEGNFVAETYTEYKEAMARAEALLSDTALTDAKITKAISDIRAAEAKLVKKVFEELYNKLKNPKAQSEYTSASYRPYIEAVNRLKEKIKGKDVEDTKLAEFNEELAQAEAGLRPIGDQVEISVTSSIGTYYNSETGINHNFAKLFDGDRNSFTWTNREQRVDDHFTFTFSAPVNVTRFRLQYPTNVGKDFLAGAKLEGQQDNQWIEFGDIAGAGEQDITVDNKTVSALRIRLTQGSGFWAKLGEVIITYSKPKPSEPEYRVALKKAIDDALAAKETVKYKNATEGKKREFDEALQQAEEFYADVNTAQILAVQATKRLRQATEQLDGVDTPQPPVVNKDKLKQAIEAAEAVKETFKYKNATANTKLAFDVALSDAKEVYEDADASTEDVEDKTTLLLQATEALDGVDTPTPAPVDKTELRKEIEKANALVGSEKYNHADADKQNEFTEALAEAVRVEAEDAAVKSDVDNATARLRSAVEAIESVVIPQPQPQPQPQPEVLLPYIPEPVEEVATAPEVVIEEEEIALSSAQDLLRFNQLTENLTKENDKELVKKLIAEKVTLKEFVRQFSEESLVEFAKDLGATFTDENSDNWYAKDLAMAVLTGSMKGYEDGTFRGQNPVTGKEFVTVLVRAHQVAVEESKEDWFAPYHKAAKEMGLLEGIRFDLAKRLSREEVAALAYNFAMLDKKTKSLPNIKLNVEDMKEINPVYLDAITYLYEKKVLTGYEDGSYKPLNDVKRSEVLAILHRLLKK